MNSYIVTFLVISTSIVLFMSILSLFIYKQQKTKLSAHIAELWLSYLTYFLASLVTEGQKPEIVAIATVLWIWRLRAYRLILEELTLGSLKRPWHNILLGAGFGLSVLGFYFGFSFFYYTMPICLVVCLVGSNQVLTSIQILKPRKLNVIYNVFLTNVLFVYINVLYYPFLRLNNDLAVYGFGLAFFTIFLTAVLLPSLLFMEQTKEQALTMKALVEERSQQLINQSKFSALGEMAAGIAHEINNPLAVISGKAGQLKRTLLQDTADLKIVASGLDNIENTAFRISRIIKGLKDFSRNADNSPMQSFGLKTIIHETLDLCRERFNHHGVKLTIGDIPDVQLMGRSFQISQVMLNVLNNAFDAVLDSNEKWIQMVIRVENEVVLIRIQDSGPGIIPEIRAKIMMPFFTTKEVGKGTGIGLSISKGIIEDHHGKFYLDHTDIRTSFIIELPTHGVVHG